MGIEYKKRENEYGDTLECNSCGCEVQTAGFDWGPPYSEPHETDKRLLCEVCASTSAGNETRDARNPNYGSARMMAQMINHLKEKMGLFEI